MSMRGDRARKVRLIRIRSLIEVALPHLDGLPPGQRADAYEGIAEATRGLDPKMHVTAHRIAAQLRDSELLQLHFRDLFAHE